VEGENSTSGPQPYQPYEAEVTNSPISNMSNSDAKASANGRLGQWRELSKLSWRPG